MNLKKKQQDQYLAAWINLCTHNTNIKLVIKVSNNSDNMKSVLTGIGGKSG